MKISVLRKSSAGMVAINIHDAAMSEKLMDIQQSLDILSQMRVSSIPQWHFLWIWARCCDASTGDFIVLLYSSQSYFQGLIEMQDHEFPYNETTINDNVRFMVKEISQKPEKLYVLLFHVSESELHVIFPITGSANKGEMICFQNMTVTF